MNTPLISIITICKNQPYIKETCESVVNQTDGNFEWIVIDGGSCDGTLDILKFYESKISILVSEADSGVYNAMNKGIKLAKGKYLLFLNGGDMFYDNKIIENVKPYLKKGDSDVYYGDSFRLFNDPKDCFIKTYPDKLEKNFFLTNTLAHQSSFIRGNLFKKYGLYREDFTIVSDKEKWLCFMDHDVKFTHLNIVCSCFRMDGVSRKKSETLRQEKIKMLKEYFPNNLLCGTDIPYLKELFG